MKKFVHIADERKAQILIDAGFKSRIENIGINGQPREIFVFIEDEEMRQLLNDKKFFTRKDYYYNSTMKF